MRRVVHFGFREPDLNSAPQPVRQRLGLKSPQFGSPLDRGVVSASSSLGVVVAERS